MKPFKKYEDRADRKAKVAQKNILREKRFRALETTKYFVEDDESEDTKAYINKTGVMPFNRKN